MLTVKVDINPYGLGKEIRRIAEITVANDGTGDVKVGHYDYLIKEDNKIVKKGKVLNYPRQERALKLVYEILEDYYSDS